MSRSLTKKSIAFLSFLSMVAVSGRPNNAAELNVKVENLQPAGGLFFTPTWVAFHSGNVDLFDIGQPASDAVEAIAEGGDTGPLEALFGGMSSSTVIAPGTPFGPMGSSFASSAEATIMVDPSDRYFSFASMIIPSNDAFIGNDSPVAYEIFSADGTFVGPRTIEILGSHIWDAGTEQNTGQGAAFSALGGTSLDENGVITMHSGLDNFVGTMTANGETIQSTFSADTPIARITITQVPEPTNFVLVATALFGLSALRFRGSRHRTVV